MRALNYRVFLRFVGHGIAPNRKYLHIITTAQGVAHRILGIAEQARTHVAIGRQAQTVAIRTKMVGHGANKANRSRRARKVPIARRARAGRSVVDVERLELAQPRRGGPGIDVRPQLIARHGIARIPQLGIERGRMRVHSAMRARVLIADGHVHTAKVVRFLRYPQAFPVDIRHNAKIGREKLAAWAARQAEGAS